MNYLLFMMGGVGSRTKKSIPKQYILINGIPIFAYTLKKYDTLDFIDKILIVADKKYENYINKWMKKLNISKVASIVQGGDYRSKSVLNGMKKCNEFARKNDILIVHDASSPYVDDEKIKEGIKEAQKGIFVSLGTKQCVTVYSIDEKNMINNIIPRDYVAPGACPDIFRFKDIFNIYNNSNENDLKNATSSIMLGIENNIKSKIIFSDLLPIKITYEEDIRIFRKLVDLYYFPNFKEEYINLLEYDDETILDIKKNI